MLFLIFSGVTEAQAANLMVEEARELLQKDLGLEITNWGKNAETTSIGQNDLSKHHLSSNNIHLSYLSKTLNTKIKKPVAKKNRKRKPNSSTGNMSNGAKKQNVSNENVSNGNMSNGAKKQNLSNENLSNGNKSNGVKNHNLSSRNKPTWPKKVHEYQITGATIAQKRSLENGNGAKNQNLSNKNTPAKGQLISKGLFDVFNSSKNEGKNGKNRPNNYDTSGRIFFVRFLEELRVPKSPFEIN
jgi:hypothetical protein